MARVQSQVVIARPVELVFARLLDLRNAEEFDPDVASVVKTTDGPIEVGTTFRFRERVPPFGRFGYVTATYTAVEQDRLIEMLVRIGPLADTGTLWFEAVEDGSRVSFEGNLKPPLLFKPFASVMARQATKTWDKRFVHIKNWIEASDSGSSETTRP